MDLNYDEIIKTIRMAISEVECEYYFDYVIAFEEAIWALEKQKAEKPKNIERKKTYADGRQYIVGSCPMCNAEVDNDLMNYCPYCGQRLDWSDGNECE